MKNICQPKIGEEVKVHIPGETPWVECVTVYEDGTWEGKILNHLVGERSEQERLEIAQEFFPGQTEPLSKLHDFKFGDVVRFGIANKDDFYFWSPTEVIYGRS